MERISMTPSSPESRVSTQTRTGYSYLALHAAGVPDRPGPLRREVTMAKHAPYSNEADYVVVGSGSGGAAVAGRLAQSGASVIVLEAGKSDDQFLVRKPGMIGPMHAEPRLKRLVDWGYYSTPQETTSSTGGCRCRAARWSAGRARSTGWSTCAATAPTTTPGPPRGTRAGTPTPSTRPTAGWRTSRTAPTTTGAPAGRSGSPATSTREDGTLQFIQATADTLGVKVLDDYNAAAQEGISRMQQNAADGLRYSASRGYLHDLPAPRLEVQTEVVATQVLIEDGRAMGVEVGDRDGRARIVRAGGEVILAAGFVGSPQLLMLSGVGHADHLGSTGSAAWRTCPSVTTCTTTCFTR